MWATVVILAAMLAVPPVRAQEATPPTVSVNGEGVMRVEPDQAIVRFGVTTSHEDPEQARALNAAASREAMNAIRELGVEERNLQLEGLRLQPEQRYNATTRQYEQVGFEAVRDVRVTLDDLDLLPVVVARVVQRGANRLNGIAYDLADRESVRNEALRLAAENARVKARLLAETLGARLGAVRSIQEQGVHFPSPQYMMQEADVAMRAAGDAPPEPEAYASGEIEVRASVGVVFHLLSGQ
jgi:hypothetical protein